MNFDYFNYKSNDKVKKGSIIFSQPLMNDKNFKRSIILICEHDRDGSFGYKLNDKDKNFLREQNFWIYGFVSNDDKDFSTIEWMGDNVLLFGSEGFGINQKTEKYVDYFVKIKINKDLELSLIHI